MVVRSFLRRQRLGRTAWARRHGCRRTATLELLEPRRLLTNAIATPGIPAGWATGATLTPTITVPIGKSLIIPLNDSDTAGLPLTCNVQSSNPNITAAVLKNNTFIDFHVTSATAGVTGDIVVALLNDIAPNTAAYLASYAQSGCYNNTIINRILPGFVDQAGSPNGTSSYAPFNNLDEFNANTIYSGNGQFAMARTSSHDTAATQFFITVGPQRSALDMNYTLFGQVVSGFAIVNAINNVPYTDNSGGQGGPPVTPITITSATVIADTSDAVIILAANSTTANNDTTTITVTTSDGQGATSAPLTFTAQAVTDPTTIDDPPILTTPATTAATWGTTEAPSLNYTTPVNTPITIPITATDITGATDVFSGYWLNNAGNNAAAALSAVTTAGTTNTVNLTITPNTDFTGVVSLAVQVTRVGDAAESAATADSRTFTIAVGDNPLTITSAMAEPASYAPGEIQMAAFTDADPAATTASFTASINWGNGLAPTTGTVVAAPGGGFAVLGTSTYANPATYTAIVNIKDSAGAAATTNVLVTIGTPTIGLVSSAVAVAGGQSITFTATITEATTTPAGTVTIFDGTTELATAVAVVNDAATFITSSLTIGNHRITAQYSGDATYMAGTSAVLVELVGSSHQRYVQQLYNDLLQRAADPGGLAAWTGLLDAGTYSYAQVATAFTSSREYDGIIVDGFYVKYLGRHAEPAGLNDWVNLMQGGYNAEQIRSGILGSPEYFADTGGTNTSFVTALYQSFLNRAPDPNGLNAWVTLLVTGQYTTAQVATGFLNSDENRTDIITNFYETYLHRAPDPGGLAAWKALLANGVTQPQIISSFVTAPEYFAINYIS